MSASRWNIGWTLANMKNADPGAASPATIFASEDGILDCYGTTVPTNGTTDPKYAPGCTFRHVDGEVVATGTVDSGDATSLIDLTLASTYDSNDELIGCYVVDLNKKIYGLIDDYAYATGDITVNDWLDYDGDAVAATYYPAAGDAFEVIKLTSGRTLYVNTGNEITGCYFEPVVTGGMNQTEVLDMQDSPSQVIWGNVDLNALRNMQGGFVYENDFMDELDPTDDAGGWSITQVDNKGSMHSEAGAPGGVIQFTSATGDTADDGINAQLENCAFLPVAGNKIYFEARIKVSQADEQWAIGLAEAGMTAAIAAGIFDDTVCKCLFGHHTGTADKINTIISDDEVQDETADVADMVDDTWVKVGFIIDGVTSVKFYVNGKLVETGSTAGTIPNEAMVLTCVAQYEAADTILSVDWVRIAQVGVRDA